jgi:hypothetical protein
MGERRYRAILFLLLISALDGDDPAALPPGKEHLVPLERRQGGPRSRSRRGSEEKNSRLAKFSGSDGLNMWFRDEETGIAHEILIEKPLGK